MLTVEPHKRVFFILFFNVFPSYSCQYSTDYVFFSFRLFYCSQVDQTGVILPF